MHGPSSESSESWERVIRVGSESLAGADIVRVTAGANIIQHNMRHGQVRVNSDVPGRVVNAIYGFCDIRNFTDCTEVE